MQLNLNYFLTIFLTVYSCNPKSTVNCFNPAINQVVSPLNYDNSKLKIVKTTPSLVLQSVDGGNSWKDVGENLPSNLRIQAAWGNNQELYLGYEKGIYRSKNNDQLQFTQDFNYNRSVEEFYNSSEGPYVINYEKGIFKESIPASSMWQNLFTTLNKEIFRSVNELSDGTILLGTDNGLFKTTDNGNTWQHVYKNSMAVNVTESKGIIIAGTIDGIIRSSDKGSSWTLVLDEDGFATKTTLLNGQFVAITKGKEKLKHLFPQPENPKNCIRISSDQGLTWQHMEQNLPEYTSIDDIVQTGKYILCSTNLGIFRTVNFGITWEKILEAKDNNVFKLIVTGNKIFAVRMPVRGC